MATRQYAPGTLRQVSQGHLQQRAAPDLKKRLSELSENLSGLLSDIDEQATSRAISQKTDDSAISRLKKIVAFRALRNKRFDPGLFADPAWDIMLDLTIAMAEKRRISVSSLCIAANVPTSTALRHIKSMVDRGLIVIVADVKDNRRKHATLSNDVYEAMLDYAHSLPL